MTLKQAFTFWAAMPANTALAATCRQAFKSVVLDGNGKRDVQEFTAFAVQSLLQKSSEPQALKTKATSILVHVLKYAAGQGACVMPDFDYTIAGTGDTKTNSNHSPKVLGQDPVKGVGREVSGEQSPEPPVGRDEFGRFKTGLTPWNAGKKIGYIGGGRKVVPVCQLHPDSLKVVARYDSIATAKLETGTFNIRRALDDHKMSGGFYWCRQGEEDSFKPGYKTSPHTEKWSRKKKNPGKDTSTSAFSLGSPSEGKRSPEESGGTHPQSWNADPATRTALSVFSDAELRSELERRGWYGTLYQRLEFQANRQSDE